MYVSFDSLTLANKLNANEMSSQPTVYLIQSVCHLYITRIDLCHVESTIIIFEDMLCF